MAPLDAAALELGGGEDARAATAPEARVADGRGPGADLGVRGIRGSDEARESRVRALYHALPPPRHMRRLETAVLSMAPGHASSASSGLTGGSVAAQAFEKTLVPPIDRSAADLPVMPDDDAEGGTAVKIRTAGLEIAMKESGR